MIEKLELTNFKCFSHAELEFKNLTILTGANATGKSSVIQALILAEHTNKCGLNFDGKWEKISIDINQVFGFQIGAPNALVSQNPEEEEDCDFAVNLFEDEEEHLFQYQINMASPLELGVKSGSLFKGRSFQYLNAERVGPRVSNRAGKGDGLTFDGENAAYIIEAADRTERPVAEQLKLNLTESNKFSYFVEKWMSAILSDLQLDIHTDYNKAITELRIKNALVDSGVVPTLTGFGISYVLPIVVAGLWASAEKDAVLLLENPEAHLHPLAQSNMGKFLALLTVCGVQVIVETHSEHIIDGARYQLACMGKTENAVINYMENENEKILIRSIYVSAQGELSSWPKGFFDQKRNDLRDIMMLGRENAKSE